MSVRESVLQRKPKPFPIVLSDGIKAWAKKLPIDVMQEWRIKERDADDGLKLAEVMLGFIRVTCVNEDGSEAFTDADMSEMRQTQDYVFIVDFYQKLVKASTVVPSEAEKNS